MGLKDEWLIDYCVIDGRTLYGIKTGMMVRLMLAVLRVLPEEWDIDGTFLYAIGQVILSLLKLLAVRRLRIPWVEV
jgi:hypothetical protein